MDVRNAQVGSTVRMAVAVTNMLKNVMGPFGVEVAIQTDAALPSHIQATNQQHA